MTHLTRSLVLGCSVLALTACGPDDIVSPGTGGNVIINNPPAPTPSPTPTPTPPATVSPAAGCPTISDPQGLTDAGTISGPTGEWRVCTLPRVIRASTTLPKVAGLLYQLNGRVDVGCDGGFAPPTAGAPFATSTLGSCAGQSLTADTNVTLTIAAGAILFGGTGQSWLAVNRGNKINAVGSETQPIIFTSRDNVLGLNDDNSQGQWGGVVLLGRGRTTDCTVGALPNTCERQTEGAPDPARFGGLDDTYNAGRMSFVQIRFSGFILGSNVELQSLTPGAIGSGTVFDHFQSFNSSDDGIEFFGGVPRMKHLIVTGADDDSLDVDTGARADFQHVLLIQRPGDNDSLFEVDSNGNEADTPRTTLRVVNLVGLQSQLSAENEASNGASMMFRGNSDTTLANAVIVTPNNECLRLNGSGGANAATFQARSVVMQCNATKYIGTGSYTAATVAAAFGTGTNSNSDAHTSTLTSLFVNGANEDAVTAFDASTLSSFFDVPSPNRIGAAWTGNNAWYTQWTCNSSYANFGTGNSGDCTSLPIT